MEKNVRGSVGTFFLGPKYVEQRGVDGPSAGVIPPARQTAASLSVDEALGLGAVYRCVSIITSAVSQMPLGVYRAGIEIDAPTVVKQPNVDLSQRQFLKDTVWSLATCGNAYWRVYGTYPNLSLEVLNPDTVTISTDNAGKKTYWQGETQLRNVKHLRLMTRPGVDKGYGPIQAGRSELIGAIKVRRFADEWFDNSGVPTGILTTEQQLNAADAKLLIDAWKTFVEGQGTALMQKGMRYEHLHINPSEAQYLEVQQAQTISIARLFGVPATLLASGNEGSSNTYMNNQELWIQFLSTTLSDYMNEIEDALSSLLPRGQVVNFKEESLLRMNTTLETEVAVAQVGAGLITRDEWRAARGLPPLGPVETPNNDIGATEDGTD